MPQAAQVKDKQQTVKTVKVKERTDKTLEFTLPVQLLPPHRSRLFIIEGDNLDDLVPKDRYPDLNEILNDLKPGTNKIDNIRVGGNSKTTKFELTIQGGTVPKIVRDNIEEVCRRNHCMPIFTTE
jgi:hypothetical protein